MKNRNPLVVVLLSVITFGIYDLYWLVVTKKVLNEKTKFHTPTIWLLILPYTLLIAGYIMLFTTGTLTSNNSTTSSSFGSSEQINTKGSPRPSQYIHQCTSSDGVQYVTQGSPNCLGNDSYQGDYGSSVPGTLFSSPCRTTSGTFRYVYIGQSENCPSGTSLEFYNTLCPTNATSSSSCSTSSSSTNTIKHPGILIASFGLIFLGFITTFSLSVFWFYRFSKAINEYTRGKMSTAVTFLILWLIHLVGVALIQDTFNDMEQESVGTPINPQSPHNQPSSIYPSATSGIGGPSTPPPSMPASPINSQANYNPPVQNNFPQIQPLPPVDLDQQQQDNDTYQQNK